MADMRSIWIYADNGAANVDMVHDTVINSLRELCLDNEFKVDLVTAEHIIQSLPINSTVKLLIVPGGRATPYVEKLSGHGCQNIKTFVYNGGAYFGLGAGAYFASSQIEFEKGTTMEICRENELKIFPGIARGTVYDGFSYTTNTGAIAAEIVFNSRLTAALQAGSCKLYYHGGCTFVPRSDISLIDSDFEVLGKYNMSGVSLSEKWCCAAIIKCNFGQGAAILSGVHPEYSMELSQATSNYRKELVSALKDYESTRKTLFFHLMKVLLDKSK